MLMLDDFFKQLDFFNFCLGNNFILIFRSQEPNKTRP